jgi:hypothetical protein
MINHFSNYCQTSLRQFLFGKCFRGVAIFAEGCFRACQQEYIGKNYAIASDFRTPIRPRQPVPSQSDLYIQVAG